MGAPRVGPGPPQLIQLTPQGRGPELLELVGPSRVLPAYCFPGGGAPPELLELVGLVGLVGNSGGPQLIQLIQLTPQGRGAELLELVGPPGAYRPTASQGGTPPRVT